MGCLGHPRDTTPTIDLLATESVVFEQHCETRDSTLSLFTGVYGDTHRGVHANGTQRRSLTMTDALRQIGFRTAFFCSNSRPYQMGLGALFDHSDVHPQNERGLARAAPEALV